MLRTLKITAAESDLAGKYRPGETVVVYVDRTSSYSLYMPDATGARDVVFLCFPDDQSGTITLTPRLNQTIGGNSTQALSGAMLVVSDGSDWQIHESAGGSLETDPVYTADLAGLTASRLVATDGSKELASVANLASWIAAASGSGLSVANDGDGSVTLDWALPYARVVVVAKSGADYSTIQSAINSITDAASNKRYCVWVMPGLYDEQVTMKQWVDVRGIGGKHCTRITHSGDNNGTVILASHCQLEDVLIECTTTNSEWAVVGDNVSQWHIRNVDILSPLNDSSYQSQGIKMTGNTWSTGFIEHCVINSYMDMGWNIYLTGNGQNIDVTINDVFADSYGVDDGDAGGGVYLSNVADIQIKQCHFRTDYGDPISLVNSAEAEIIDTRLESDSGYPSLNVASGCTVTVRNVCGNSYSNSGTMTGLYLDVSDESLGISGDLGVGTFAPARRGEFTNGNDCFIRIKTTVTAKAAQTEYETLDNGTSRAYVGLAADNHLHVWNQANTRIMLATNNSERVRIDENGNVFLYQVKSGATQVAAGAAAGEVWKTSGHATLPDNVLMIGA